MSRYSACCYISMLHEVKCTYNSSRISNRDVPKDALLSSFILTALKMKPTRLYNTGFLLQTGVFSVAALLKESPRQTQLTISTRLIHVKSTQLAWRT